MKNVFMMGFLFVLGACTLCGESRADNYTCEDTSVYKSGTVDVGRCGYENWVACYEDVEETCRSDSGQTNTRKYRRFTGDCEKFVSGCY